MDFLLAHKSVIALTILITIACAYFIFKSPTHNKDWQDSQKKLPHITKNASGFEVANIRDFRYDNEKNSITKNYNQKSYQYNNLKMIWFGLSHFGNNGLAHAFLSFEFSSNRYLTLSIEARTEKNQKYHPILGLLKHYEKIYIFGTETDIIGLRTHARKEKVLLYPINMETSEQIQLLKTYIDEAKTLESTPNFYNTLLDNCMTGLLRASGKFSTWDFLSEKRLILPGKSDGLAQELGLIDPNQSLETLRQKAKIDPLLSDPNDSNFSKQIRSGWK
ncbi:MAG: DUF4105 domain-containing protein [Cellvibrionaceae bacterium]